MKTNDLIKTLSEDSNPPQPLWRKTGWAAAAGIVGAGVLFLAFIGVRPDIGAAMSTWRFNVKLLLVAVAIFMMAWEFMRLLRPQAQPRMWPVMIVAGAVAIAVALELMMVPSAAWTTAAVGTNWRACLVTIPFLAILPLAAALWAMREGAPSAPGAAGAIAGGVSAALGGLLYATHCPDDSPLFVAIWYPLAAAIVVAAGALLGRSALRW